MKIECPSCHLTGNVPDDKAAPGVFATCPKCTTRFALVPAPPAPPPPTVVCPKCAARQEGEEICLSCGVVFAKYARAHQELREALPVAAELELPPPPPLGPDVASGRSRVLSVTLLLILLAALAGFFYTPHLAVKRMKAAAEERNAEKLARHVNFPLLKENLKAALNAKVAAEAAKEKDNPFASLGAALAAAFMGPLVDALVTPESLAMIVKGEKPELGKSRKEPATAGNDTETTMAYESLNSFVVTVKKKDDPKGESIGLVFSREGVFAAWRLSAVRLPL